MKSTRKNLKKKSNTRKHQKGGWGVLSKLAKVPKNQTATATTTSSSSTTTTSSSNSRGAGSSANQQTINFGKAEGQPVMFREFIVSPEIGNQGLFGGPVGRQYSLFDQSLMNQILKLRKEAFPDEYKDKDYPSEIWETPLHCKPEPGSLSIENRMYNLYYFTDKAKKEYEEDKKLIKELGILSRMTTKSILIPTLISNCAVILCDLASGLRIGELVGVATFAKFQKQSFGTKLLQTVFNSLSDVRINVDYIWLYFDRTKPYLGKFYSQFGFKEITESDTDQELKEIYIGKDYLYNHALKNKEAKFYIDAQAKYRKNTGSGMKLEFVNEEKYDSWAEQKKEEVYKQFVYTDYKTGEVLKNKTGKNIPDNLTKKTVADFGGNVKKYKQAIFDVWITKPVYKPLIMTKQMRDDLKMLTEEEKYKALEFERNNVQMVLSIADWVYQMNKL